MKFTLKSQLEELRRTITESRMHLGKKKVRESEFQYRKDLQDALVRTLEWLDVHKEIVREVAEREKKAQSTGIASTPPVQTGPPGRG